MKHRDRVMTALSREKPDRCPMQISFTPEFAGRLRRDMQMRKMPPYPSRGETNPYDLERALGEDMLLTSVGWANSYYMAEGDYTDEWGIQWHPIEYDTKFGKGRYTEVVGRPLAEDDAIAGYKAPDPNRPELYQESSRLIREYKNEYYIVGVTVTTIFECAWALRGLDKLLLDFLINPDLAEVILDIPYRFHLTAAKRLVEMGVDMIWIGDDVGAQQKMLISPELWRRFLKPRMANFIATIKAINPGLKVAYHCDGMLWPIVPDLIEIGVDVLNPIQPACMDPAKVKDTFGDELCFWGTIDEQRTLPYETPEGVAKEVITRLNTIGRDGGLIIGPTHHVQLDTPLENFWAMVNTITGIH